MSHWMFVGANSDIALAIARNLDDSDVSRITLLSRDADELARRASDLHARLQVEIETAILDLASDGASDAWFSACDLPDVVVLAAGVLRDTGDLDESPGDLRKTLRVNYEALVAPCEILAQRMRERKSGSIIGLSSVAGLRARPSNYVYGSTKAAMNSYLDGLRLRCKDSGVHVLTALIGMVDSKMTEHKQLPAPITATPEAVALSLLRGVRRKRSTMYCPGYWRWIMLIVRLLPGAIVKKL